MGLDMYLAGEIFYTSHDQKRQKKDGFEIERVLLQMGHWRRHWALHNYIEYHFQEHIGDYKIILDQKKLRAVAKAVEEKDLGKIGDVEEVISDPESIKSITTSFNAAADWLDKKEKEKGVWCHVEYYGSW